MRIANRKPERQVGDVSIVLLGDFNPRIFHPMWFAKEDLLRESEVEDAKIEVVHQDVAAFSTDWLTVQVMRDRFTAIVKADAYIVHLSDLVRGVFQRLHHTPVRQMGMNVEQRLRFKAENDWHALGHFLLPKTPWRSVIGSPGLRAVHVQGMRDDDRAGHVVITVEPDLRTRTDVVVRVNDHYELGMAGQQVGGAGLAVALIESSFKASMSRAVAAVDQLIANFLNTDEVDDGS